MRPGGETEDNTTIALLGSLFWKWIDYKREHSASFYSFSLPLFAFLSQDDSLK
jgi:hypothetical protein